ncbi:hypothetical protein [Nitrosospira sp. NRS527]|uniref:hypothetical protein n=1 Tax=Nitrosospira sp. NRS527 TaxID=155925 RepID=UPI001AF8AB98|nr:hypothetical protein [Nitrosospira sp. NRS527]BCT68111.1 hypothetical protein NNRS527_01703 [Nitrosospira sp. NRS527]
MSSVNKLTFSHPITPTRFPVRLALATCTYVFAMLGGLGNAFSAPNDIAGDPKKALTVTEQYNLPIAEVSGLAIVWSIKNEKRGANEDSVNLYAIGDKRYEVANFRANGVSDAIMDVHDAAPVIGKDKKDVSEWEAIAMDGKDTICMLSETRSEISCIDRGLQQDRGSFSLDTSSISDLDSAWQARPNSRGEGMILMKKGHVLVLKEKEPPMLVEFGPEGDAPMGYGPSTFLQAGEAFAGLQSVDPDKADQPGQPDRRASSQRLVALKTWKFSAHLSDLAKDASEITLGPDGRVYLLSQEGSALIRLERILKPDENKVGVDQGAYWNLPAGLEKAEGLVIDTHMRPWIGIDIKQTHKPNLFRLSPIEAATPE